jgi:DNA-binding CsgD family transcriptional regulator
VSGSSGPQRAGPKDGLRLAELLATVSLASDLAHDVPAESALTDALLAVRLGRLAGWSTEDLSDVYYLALLYHVGCTGAVAAQSRLGVGDDVSVRRWMSEADFADRPEMFRIAVTRLARQWGPAEWAQGMAAFMSSAQGVPRAFASVAEVAVRLSERLGATPRVTAALGHAYARWDGKVFAGLPGGEGQLAIARLVHLVHVAQTYHNVGGVDAADAVVRGRSGSEFDPELARLWLESSHDILRSVTGESVWDEALASEPEPHRRVARAYLDDVSRAMADFVDLKSPFTHGHSTRLARLVEDAGAEVGLERIDIITLRRAAQVHDLGNVSVPNRVWLKRGPLNPSDLARVRLHAYHTQRIMSVTEALRPSGDVAGLHHERVDGSGYHRGLPASALPLGSRLLMVAEVYLSMTEERAWRPAMGTAEAAAEVRGELSSGRLDRRAVDAVLAAAGQPSASGRSARSWPAGLTDREVEVLRLLAKGNPNKHVARSLHVSEATVKTHIINLYGKIGVNTRAGATLFALEHDLIQVPAH